MKILGGFKAMLDMQEVTFSGKIINRKEKIPPFVLEMMGFFYGENFDLPNVFLTCSKGISYCFIEICWWRTIS